MTKCSPPTTVREDTPHTIDELAFMLECAARLNAFIRTYPEEAQHVLRTFVPYEHELVEVHEKMRPRGNASLPGVTFGALFAAVLQTHHGKGYYMRPVVEDGLILRLEVVRQEEDGDALKA